MNGEKLITADGSQPCIYEKSDKKERKEEEVGVHGSNRYCRQPSWSNNLDL